MSRQQIAQGEHAFQLIRSLTPTSIQMQTPTGPFLIQPGTYDTEQRMFIVGRVGPHVLYMQGSILYRSEIAHFVQGYSLGQIANDVYRRTRWIIPATQIMLALTMGFSLGALGALGTVASLTVVAAKITVFHQTHQRQVDQARQHVGTIVRVLGWLHNNCPISFAKMGAAVGPVTWSLLVSAGRGASASDIAFIIGRFFGGLWSSAGSSAFATLLRLTTNVVGAVASRLPGAVMRGVGGNSRAIADRFIQALQQSQVTVSPAEVDRLRQEFQQHPDVVQQMNDLNQAVQQVSPVLQALSDAFRIEAMPEIQAQATTP